MSFLQFLRSNAPFLLAGVLLSFGSSFGQTFFISLFAGVILSDLGITNGQWGLIYALGTTASAVSMVWIGGLTDIYRVRGMALFVIPALALACLAMATVTNAFVLVVVIFALRLAGQGMMSHLAITAMARWFVATRGRALSISTLGFSLGQAALPLIFVALLNKLDWRILWVIAALVTLGLMPVLLRLLRHERTPQSVAAKTESAGMNGQHWTRRKALRHWLFWLALPMTLGPPAWGTALFFQQVHLTEVKGWSLVEFVALFPLYTAVAVGMSLASGALIDRFGTARITALYPVPWVVSFAVLAFADTIGQAAVGLCLVGIAQGMQATVPPAYWAEFYGTRHIGSLKALAAGLMVLGSALGPGISGVLIDLGIDFPGQMLGIAGYFLISFAFMAIGIMRAKPLLPSRSASPA